MLNNPSYSADEWSLPTGSSIHPPILIIGLGNPILGDDGVGWHVAECIKDRLVQPGNQLLKSETNFPVRDVEVDCLSLGGLALMERMVGYEQVILIDAMQLWDVPIGATRCFSLNDLPPDAGFHLSSSHDTSLKTALQIGKEIDAKLPDSILIVGIRINPRFEFSEELSDPVSKSVPTAANLVLELLR